MYLLSLPTEVVLEVFKYLSTSEILSLRQTCTVLAKVSKDKLIWYNLIQEQCTRLPSPSNVRSSLEAWSAEALEVFVIDGELIDELWLVPRETPPVKLQKKRGELLLGLEIFLDRWILAVYMDGYINLWDKKNATEDRRWCFVYTGNDKTTSYQTFLDDKGDKLLVIITRAHMPGTWVACLYQILLSDSPSNLEFTLLCTFPTSSSRIARQIHPRERIIAFSQLGSIELAQWSEDSKENVNSVLISDTQSDELEEMFTTILSLRILGDQCIFVFKTRSIELYSMPNSKAAGLQRPSIPSSQSPLLRHIFPGYNFRDVQISDVEVEASAEKEYSSSLGGGARYTLKMLASDIIQGLFYFIVNITIPSMQQQLPILDVHLEAIYAMANNIPFHSKAGPQRQQQIFPRVPGSLVPLHSAVRDHAVSGRLSMPRSDRASSGRTERSSSFVSTYAIGPQGMRAVWIERRRGSTLKQIVCCRLTSSFSTMDFIDSGILLDPDMETSPESPIMDNLTGKLPQALDGKVVYSIESYDLREDITHCAIGEVSGKIIMGNRSGDVFILDTGV